MNSTINSILKIFKPPNNSASSTIQSLSLISDRPSLTYHGGEVVTGHCIVNLNGVLDISQIEIKLSGKAKVDIPTISANQQHDGKHQYRQTSNGKWVVINDCSVLKLVYHPATVYNSSLSPGRHDIGYSFMIPMNVPSAYESQFGSVTYKLKAKINGHEVKNAELKLNIISSPMVSPNELWAPISVSNDKTVGLIGGKKVELKCHVPQTGFTLGSLIPINCKISNLSKKSMILKCSLQQEVTFKSDMHHTHIVTNKLNTTNGPQIEPKSESTHDLTLQVPINQPIIHNTCPLISIKYLASVKLDIPGSFDLVCKLPLLLTNQPMNKGVSQDLNSNNNIYPPYPGTQETTNPTSVTPYPPLPLPPQAMPQPLPY